RERPAEAGALRPRVGRGGRWPAAERARRAPDRPVGPIDVPRNGWDAGGMDIAVIGGHGKVALLAEPLLAQAGHTVHAVIRNPGQQAGVGATGAQPGLADSAALDAGGGEDLLRDKAAVIWGAGGGGGSPQRTYGVDRGEAIASMDAAGRVGARR